MGVVRAQLSESVGSFRDVFRNRGLRRINLALAGSVIGDWAYAIAVSIWAYQQGGATALGVFGVLRYVSLAFFGPLFATLADRFPRRRVMIGADAARAVMVVIGAVAIETDAPAIVVYALALTTSVAGTAFRPAQAATLPSLATNPKELTGANVVASTVESVGFFVGPAIGALLLSIADLTVVYGFNAATFAWSGLMLLGLPAQDAAGADAPAEHDDDTSEAAAPAADERFIATVTAGFRTIAGNRHLRLITLLYTAQTIVAGASAVYTVTIALELLDLSESGVGLLDSVLGVGGLIGGFVAMTLARRERLATDFGIGVVLWSAPLLLIVASPTLGATLAAMFLIGVANSLVDINAYTIIQRVAPPEVMGRVFGALESVIIAGMAIGALVMPLLIGTIGLRSGLAVVGASVAAIAMAGIAGLARMDTTVLAPPGLALLRTVPSLSPLPAPVLE
ncbi:MAG: MFS transporter, partial [Actinomycetota bacterium]|nr:MFS transporter [Actinomycetota bacterium]